jgi:exopolysaccharide biosynthesis WecB/TagA/CpsF family protein
VGVNPTNYQECLQWVLWAAHNRTSGCVDHMPVHGLVSATENGEFAAAIATFDIVAPDGQPVRWALNHFYKTGLSERVYGPDFTLMVCQAAAEQQLPIYFYGSTERVLAALKEKLQSRFPTLCIAGMESPPFRPLSAQEDAAVIERIGKSGAQILFIGLGCPKQELFAAAHKGTIHAPMLCVGAAFDFHAGVLDQAPGWMQKRGLEWLYRLTKEPGRLWKRYALTNSKFLWLFIKSLLTRRA